MAKKKIAVMAAVLLIFSMFPELALGAGVSLDLSRSDAAVGDSVTVSGSAGSNEPVYIKVTDSSGSIVVFDLTRSDAGGDYSYSFKVPRFASGSMTVTAGCGSQVASKTLAGGSVVPRPPLIIPEIIEPVFVLDEVVRSQIISSRGAIIKTAGVMLTFPLNAVSENIKVSIKKMREDGIPSIPSGLKLLGEVYEFTTDKEVIFAKPVTVTLYFDQEEAGSGPYDLGIYCWNGKQWVPLEQIKTNLESGRVSGTVNHFSKFAVLFSEKSKTAGDQKPPAQEISQPVECQDIANHWAEKYIKQLMAAGAVSGYPDGTFKPDHTITRAEFTAMAVKAFGLQPENGRVFTDTDRHWAKDSISSAVAHGIVSGYDETVFGPDDPITREQMAVVISLAAGLSGGEAKTYADNSQIADWAWKAVAAASGKDIISGYPDNTFGPKAYATRAEAVTIIARALK